MTTPAAFYAEALPWARSASAQTGVLVSVILAQWAIETEYGGPDWSPNNNPGNVGSFDGQPVAKLPTLAEGVAAYVQLMNAPDRPNFAAKMRISTQYAVQAYLLGAANPVWASGRYALPGGAPGSEIVSIIQRDNLAQYDNGQPPPPPPAPASPVPEGVDVIDGWVDPATGKQHLTWRDAGNGHLMHAVSGTDAKVSGGWSVTDVTDAIEAAYPGTTYLVSA